MADQNVRMFQGDDFTLKVEVEDQDGNTVDVSDANDIIYKIAATAGSTADVTKKKSDGDITVSSNTFEVTLKPSDTKNLSGMKHHEAEVENNSGDKSTVVSGRLIIDETLV